MHLNLSRTTKKLFVYKHFTKNIYVILLVRLIAELNPDDIGHRDRV